MATKRKDVEQTQERPVNQPVEASTSPQDDMVLLDQCNAAKAVLTRVCRASSLNKKATIKGGFIFG